MTAKLTIIDESPRVIRAVDKANYRSLGHAAASLRRAAAALIRRIRGPSRPGDPPHTKQGQLRRALRFAVENPDTAVIGPMASVMDEAAGPLEHGGIYMGAKYDARPFMGPTLAANEHRIIGPFGGSVSSG